MIRKSVFSVVRHPAYLSEIPLYLGLLMLSISLAAAVVWVVAIGFLHYISRYEERLLLERVGKEYELYMREVPICIPRLRKRCMGQLRLAIRNHAALTTACHRRWRTTDAKRYLGKHG